MATKIVTKNSSTASAVPTASDLVQGELAVNVADKRLFTEDNGGSIVELGTNPSTLTVAGEITANGGIALGDSDKATFGAGADLQIYHDGSNSYVKDAGTGTLNLQGSTQVLIAGANGTVGVQFVEGGGVNLRHNNSQKLSTTSAGIQVTGNIANASGNLTLDVAGDIILDADGGDIQFKDGGTEFGRVFGSSNNFYIQARQSDKDIILQGID